MSIEKVKQIIEIIIILEQVIVAVVYIFEKGKHHTSSLCAKILALLNAVKLSLILSLNTIFINPKYNPYKLVYPFLNDNVNGKIKNEELSKKILSNLFTADDSIL